MTKSYSAALPDPNAIKNNERSEATPSKPSPGIRRSFPERIVQSMREIKAMQVDDRLFTDHPNLYPLGLSQWSTKEDIDAVAKRIAKHSLPLKLMMNKEGVSVEAEGQASLVHASNGSFLITVKHNFCKEYNKSKELERCAAVTVVIPKTRREALLFSDSMRSLINWDATSLKDGDDKKENPEIEGKECEQGENDKITPVVEPFYFNNPDSPGASWKYGYEIVTIPLEDETELKKNVDAGHVIAFDPISSEVKLEADMTVGILACSYKQLLADSICLGLREGEYTYIPQPFDVFVLIGKIDYVGEKHVEYSVNSAPGFSGAPVFLLTKDENHMKLIGSHAGFSNNLGKNFGFLLPSELSA